MPELERLKQTRRATCASTRWCGCAGCRSSARPPRCWWSISGFEFDLPIWACLAVIALSAWLNVALRIRFRHAQRLEPDRAAWLLAFDIAELAVLLFLTGGLENPFAFLFLGPVLLSATALPPRMTRCSAASRSLCATVLVFVHYPLPWAMTRPAGFPGDLHARRLALDPARDRLHRRLCVADHRGIAAARRCAGRDRTRARARAASLAARRACRRRRARARHAAVDHLGDRAASSSARSSRTRRMPTTSRCCANRRSAAATSWPSSPNCRPRASRSTACRCRADRGGGRAASQFRHRDRRQAARRRDRRRSARAIRRSSTASAICWRTPSISRASGSRSPPTGTTDEIGVTISDDGPGFAPEIMSRIGEPYVRSRRRRRMYAQRRHRPRTGLLHRQDAAGTLRRHADLREPAVPATAARL